MKNKEFFHWVQGYLALCPDDAPDLKKIFIIRNHLNLVHAVEGYLGELNTALYALTENAVLKKAAPELPAALHQVQDYMRTHYTHDL